MNKVDKLDSIDGSEIAVIGMAGRFPGAKDISEYWQNLRDGVESIKTFSDQELEAAGVDPAILSDPNYVKANAVLEDVEMFDAAFFGISPRDAAIMDPQHRLFLECATQALESAGYDSEAYEGSIGIYAGSGMNTYMIFNLASNLDLMKSLGLFLIRHLGNDKDFLTTRVSYHLNLKGPSVNVQTACSTSLVAIHLACQSLLNAECDMALAGGVTVKTPQKMGYWYREGEIQSPDGHCRAFDAKAQGTVFGSGVGVVVLKPLADAIEAGDYVHAVIKGSAINNDGSLKVGYMAPSVQGYEEVVAEALALAGVEAETISYIAAHGTGTPMGDAIEIAALTQAFQSTTQDKGFCAIGSVKTNVGHVDMAAGVASLMAATLALKYKLLPPSLNFEQPNPEIDFANSPFYVNSVLSEWRVDQGPRRAGVSSMGIGGTNAHVVLEEAPLIEPSGPSRPWQLLVLSAKTSSALDAATANLAEHLRQHPDLNLADVAYTYQVGRRAFNHRRMLVCRDPEDAMTALETLEPKRVVTATQTHRSRPVVFVFPGEGAPYVNVGLELYQIEMAFREQVDYCSELLEPHLGFDLRQVLYPSGGPGEAPGEEAELQFDVAQLALFVIEYALARLWLSWGLHPQAMFGHGIGEYVAGCLAEVFSLEDALALVVARARLAQKLPGGDMFTVPLDPHTETVNPVVGPFTELVKNVILSAPKIPYLSSVTGTWITAGEAMDPAYWARHMHQRVDFAEGVDELLKEPDWVLLEVGPASTLNTQAKGYSPGHGTDQLVLSSLRHPDDQQSDVAFLLNTLGQLWLAGIQVDWSGFYANERRHRVPLPTYPFERQRYWIDPPSQIDAAKPGEVDSSLLDSKPDLQHAYVAPRNEVERTLAGLWQNVLGIKQVGIYDRFFELGGDSHLAADLFAQINKEFGKNLPLATLFEAPTIAELASILRKEEWSAAWSSLVPIQPNGSKPPFFCVHAYRGNVLSYYDLAHHLGTDRPFYGLQAQGLNGGQAGSLRLEDMAARYIQEIRTIQPRGPYFLGGWCFGGEVAYEMAQQLQAQGEEVALVTMLQNPHRDHLKLLSRTPLFRRLAYGMMESIENEMSLFLGVEPKDKLSYIVERTGKVMKIVRGKAEKKIGPLLAKFHLKIGHSQAYTLEDLAEAHTDAYWRYEPRPYRGGRVALFWASKQPLGIYYDLPLGWSELVEGELETHVIPGHHHGSFLSEPHVQVLAEQLRDCLDKAQNGGEPTDE